MCLLHLLLLALQAFLVCLASLDFIASAIVWRCENNVVVSVTACSCQCVQKGNGSVQRLPCHLSSHLIDFHCHWFCCWGYPCQFPIHSQHSYALGPFLLPNRMRCKVNQIQTKYPCHGAMVTCCCATKVPRCHSSMLPGCHSTRVPQCQGSTEPGCHGARVAAQWLP